MYAFIKGSTGQIASIRAEGHAVHRFLVPRQRMNTNTLFYIPKSDCRVKWCTTNKQWHNFSQTVPHSALFPGKLTHLEAAQCLHSVSKADTQQTIVCCHSLFQFFFNQFHLSPVPSKCNKDFSDIPSSFLKNYICRVPTKIWKQNSMTFPWLICFFPWLPFSHGFRYGYDCVSQHARQSQTRKLP